MTQTHNLVRAYPEYICHECGVRFCKGITKRSATYHIGRCQCCGAQEVPVTEPRDYGYFKHWPLKPHEDPMPIPDNHEQLIQHVIRVFDFEKVHKAMTALNWQWASSDGLQVPSIDTIKGRAEYLLHKVIKMSNDSSIGTGGLEAYKHEDGLSLRFVLTNSESYFQDFQKIYDESDTLTTSNA